LIIIIIIIIIIALGTQFPRAKKLMQIKKLYCVAVGRKIGPAGSRKKGRSKFI